MATSKTRNCSYISSLWTIEKKSEVPLWISQPFLLVSWWESAKAIASSHYLISSNIWNWRFFLIRTFVLTTFWFCLSFCGFSIFIHYISHYILSHVSPMFTVAFELHHRTSSLAFYICTHTGVYLRCICAYIFWHCPLSIMNCQLTFLFECAIRITTYHVQARIC